MISLIAAYLHFKELHDTPHCLAYSQLTSFFSFVSLSNTPNTCGYTTLHIKGVLVLYTVLAASAVATPTETSVTETIPVVEPSED
jgi:hypothetical protein